MLILVYTAVIQKNNTICNFYNKVVFISVTFIYIYTQNN